jgi:hypothetical protein
VLIGRAAIHPYTVVQGRVHLIIWYCKHYIILTFDFVFAYYMQFEINKPFFFVLYGKCEHNTTVLFVEESHREQYIAAFVVLK